MSVSSLHCEATASLCSNAYLRRTPLGRGTWSRVLLRLRRRMGRRTLRCLRLLGATAAGLFLTGIALFVMAFWVAAPSLRRKTQLRGSRRSHRSRSRQAGHAGLIDTEICHTLLFSTALCSLAKPLCYPDLPEKRAIMRRDAQSAPSANLRHIPEISDALVC